MWSSLSLLQTCTDAHQPFRSSVSGLPHHCADVKCGRGRLYESLICSDLTDPIFRIFILAIYVLVYETATFFFSRKSFSVKAHA